jgi:predicted DNA-binding antitoxin AbrB/MazE fold protein
MQETITAIYKNGVLYPLQPLNLQEDQSVQLQLLPTKATLAVSAKQRADTATLLGQLRDSGFVTIAMPSPQNAISDQALELLVKTLPTVAVPTSQTLIEERGEW